MRTIEEENNEYVRRKYGFASAEKVKETLDVFKAGVKFAQRWIPVEEELPVCCESGNWDGLRSDYVLIKHSDGECRKAILYSGIMDGSEYNDWYSEHGYELGNIIEWRPLNFY